MINHSSKSVEDLKVLTWHIHGSYLYYLTQVPCQWYLPVKADTPGYGGRAGAYAWGDNVHEVPADDVANLDLDLIIFQSKRNYEEDQYDILTESQRTLPRLYLEHDPPRKHPTDTKHFVSDRGVGIVHVTHFNQLMWDNNHNPSYVIDHGVVIPDHVVYTGELEKGIVVINNLHSRGRRLGLDVFTQVRREIPLDLIGMGAAEVGGLGEIPHNQLPEFVARYRFFFNPIRYTSLGLAVCEAMTIGLPVVGLATTEMAVSFKNGETGFVHTQVDQLIAFMQKLLADRTLAQDLSKNARSYAQRRFGIDRFVRDWRDLMIAVTKGDKQRANGFQRERIIIR